MHKSIVLPALLFLSACGAADADPLATARSALAAQDFAAARITLVSALKDEPANPALLDLLADVQLRMGDGVGARATLDRLAAAGGKGLRFDQLSAEMLLRTGRPEAALEKLGTNSDPESLRIRAAASLALGDDVGAFNLFQRGLDAVVQPQAVRLAFDFATHLAEAGDLVRARRIHAQMAAAAPKAFEPRLLEARIALLSGDTKAAQTAYAQTAAGYPKRIEPVCGQAEALDAAGDLKAGLKLLDEAEKRLPGQPCVTAIRVSLLAQQGDWGKIRALLQDSESQLDPASGVGLSYAEAMMRLGRPELARAMFSRALAASPQNPYARLMLGEAQLETGDARAAHATLAPLAGSVLAGERELQLAARAARSAGLPVAASYAARLAAGSWKQAAATNAEGLAAVARQDWPAAITAWQKLAASGDPEIQRRLTYALHRAGRHAEALAAADRLLTLAPENADAIYLAGLVRVEGGVERDRGLALLTQAHQRQPGNWLIRQALAKAKAAVS